MITQRNRNGRIVSEYPDTKTTQYCPACEVNKTFDNFYKDKRGKNGLTRRCKACWSKKSYYSRTRSPESIDKNYWRVATNRYGITKDEFYVMLESQGNKCKICKREADTYRRLTIDHDHNTGKIRGILCGQCNSGLGLFKDDVYIMKEAIRYIKESLALSKPV